MAKFRFVNCCTNKRIYDDDYDDDDDAITTGNLPSLPLTEHIVL